MDEMNQNNINQMISQEIPIPEMNGTQPYGQQGQPMVQPYHPNGGKKRGKVLIIVACVIAGLAILGGSAWAYYTGTPGYKIAKGFENLALEIDEMRNPLSEKLGMEELLVMMQDEGSHVTTKLDFTAETEYGSATLGVDTDFYKDSKAKEMDSSTDISVMNYNFAHLDLYGNEDVICFSVPELFLEDMYFETENIVSQYNNSILADDAMFGKLDMEDFSIELFPEDEERISVGSWRDMNSYLDSFDEDLEACREGMKLEKAEKGIYRVTIREQDANRFIKDIMKNYKKLYPDQSDGMEILEEYESLIASDVKILFVIGKGNKIESINMEEPIRMLDGEASLDGEIFLLGEERSIDKVQCKLTITNILGEKAEVICQVVQSLEENDYQVGMDLKYTQGDLSDKMKFTMNCDAVKDTFDMSFSMKEEKDTFEFNIRGSLDDIVPGESLAMDLKEFTMIMDGEELCNITGDIMVEPLQEKITPSAEAKNALFELTYSDIGDIAYKLIEEYGSLLDLLDY